MSGERVVLVGPLADARMLAVLGVQGRAVVLPGGLRGGARAGLEAGGWPCWTEGPGVPGVEVEMTQALRRYAAVFGLAGPVWGAQDAGSGAGDWPGDWPCDLAVEIAWIILTDEVGRSPEDTARRLPMIGIWAGSRLRAQAFAPPATDLLTEGRVDLDSTRQPYAEYFSVQHLHLRHSLHDGGMSEPLERAVFGMGDAVVVLPYDPQRDRVLLIDQMRAAPVAMGDPQPWLLEGIAGRIDAGETPEDAARREAVEEAGLSLGRLIPAPLHYPSPAAVAERIYPFIGLADLPNAAAGVHGLASEAEDIRSHPVPREELDALVEAGAIRNGPLLILALWLRLHLDQLRAGQ